VLDALRRTQGLPEPAEACLPLFVPLNRFAAWLSKEQPEAQAILSRLEESHPDPKVRRLCKLARGESMHQH